MYITSLTDHRRYQRGCRSSVHALLCHLRQAHAKACSQILVERSCSYPNWSRWFSPHQRQATGKNSVVSSTTSADLTRSSSLSVKRSNRLCTTCCSRCLHLALSSSSSPRRLPTMLMTTFSIWASHRPPSTLTAFSVSVKMHCESLSPTKYNIPLTDLQSCLSHWQVPNPCRHWCLCPWA